MGGFVGQILKVNLTKAKMRKQKLKEIFYKKWFGGYGLGARMIYSDITPRTDPLGPGNIIGFTTGVLTGTLVPLSGSFTAVGKSPLTGAWNDSRCGGFFGPVLKKSSFDAVFVTGKAPTPVYICINEEEVTIKDASEVWGKTTSETEKAIKENHGQKVQVACIGPSGEKLSKISGIMHDRGRAAARGGLGAVMGSKNLKAVAVTGDKEVAVEDIDKLKELRRNFVNLLKASWTYWAYDKYGTTGPVEAFALIGESPIRNWAGVGAEEFRASEKIGSESIYRYAVRSYGCWGCPLSCGAWVKVENGPYASETHRPEYETVAALGGLLLNDNVESIICATAICNEYGLDTISVGAAIAFAMECYEKGLITSKDTDGVELKWGDPEVIVQMTGKIARREGFGNVLADGVKAASEKIGGGSEQYAMHVGGQELPMLDPKLLTRHDHNLGLAYVVDATPGRHTHGLGLGHAVQALGVCSFIGWMAPKTGGVDSLYSFLKAVTGWNLTKKDFRVVSDRIVTLRQSFNFREGFKPSDFRLPSRVRGKPPHKSGPLKGVTLDLEPRIKEHFKSMGWDYATGKPSLEKLKELGLEVVIEDLY
ncbi:MAG: aldehyde ferredoxin oxidoreductase family protein [Candidatus Bathyarchaeota archaeon]|nr:aldehyde ferredoxin oxidoreductase family protein [Candidatus Bathyarchaeota archaeon]